MRREPIAEVSIDREGRLCVAPDSAEFPLIYREAMELTWHPASRALRSAIPREWTYERRFLQILEATRQQGVELFIGSSTRWANVDASTKAAILNCAGSF